MIKNIQVMTRWSRVYNLTFQPQKSGIKGKGRVGKGIFLASFETASSLSSLFSPFSSVDLTTHLSLTFHINSSLYTLAITWKRTFSFFRVFFSPYTHPLSSLSIIFRTSKEKKIESLFELSMADWSIIKGTLLILFALLWPPALFCRLEVGSCQTWLPCTWRWMADQNGAQHHLLLKKACQIPTTSLQWLLIISTANLLE